MRSLTEEAFRRLRSMDWRSADKSLRRVIGGMVRSDPLCVCDQDLSEAMARYSSIYVKWNAGWGADCSVSIRLRGESVCHGDDEHEVVTVEVDVNWSSCHRSVSNAVAALSVYRRAVEFASVIETMFSGEYLLLKGEEE